MTRTISGYTFFAVGALFGLSVASGASADAGTLTESCVGCHGKGGANTEAAIPNIGGYSKVYMTDALNLYKTQERPCPETTIPDGAKKGEKSDMCQAVKDLSDVDIEQIVGYFAAQKFTRTPQQFDPALAKKGEKIHKRNCEKCHTESGSVADDDAGILAGQKMTYLDEQIKFFNEGKRPISKKMKPKLGALSKDEIEAVLHYYSSFK